MKVQTLRFGAIEVPEAEVLRFPEGLVGMPELKSFTLLDPGDGGPFRWLQSLDAAPIAFLVVDPTLFFKDYLVGVRAEDLTVVGLDDVTRAYVMVILTLGDRVEQTTANLQGPLVLNTQGRLGRQLVVSDPKWSTRTPLFGGPAPC